MHDKILMTIEACEYSVTLGDGEVLFLVKSFTNPSSWKITAKDHTLSRELTWVYEPMPRNRDNLCLSPHRYTYDEAFQLIREYGRRKYAEALDDKPFFGMCGLYASHGT